MKFVLGRKRNGVVLLVLVCLLFSYLFIAQDYTQGIPDYGSSDEELAKQASLIQDIRETWGEQLPDLVGKKRIEVKEPTVSPIGDHFHNKLHGQGSHLPAFTNQLPPPQEMQAFFGNAVARDETKNEFIANPDDMFEKVLPNGRVQMLFKNNGIKKYTNFGNPEDFNCNDEYCFINGRTVKKELISESPDDMFTFLPPESDFLEEFRNPCWRGRDMVNEEKLFCVPYFYIIGFTKCGTTDLFAILKNHTLVSSRAGKETHYFDRQRRGKNIRMHRKPDRLPQSFISWSNAGKFRTNLISTYHKYEGQKQLFHGITMDATPSHVWDNEYWEIFHPGYREPPVTNPDVIGTISPKAKIIVSLRDPIKRMQSAYQFFCAFHVYNCDKPVTNEKFHNLVVEAVDLFNKCRETNTIRGCVYSTDAHQLATHLYASIYSVYLEDWLKVFPRKQIYVMMLEEHVVDEVSSINSITDFLEIPRFGDDRLSEFLERHMVRNSLRDDKRIPYILPETMVILEEFFKPFLRDLVKLLGDEKWKWNYEL